jgi:hypothetical protein
MKILNILKTEPDEVTRTLLDAVSKGDESSVFNLYEADSDYGRLLDLVFENDKVVSWW